MVAVRIWPFSRRRDVFLSYKSEDEPYVAALHGALEAVGVPAWYDHKVPNGARWNDVLRQRVDDAGALLAVMSTEGGTSQWIKLEVARALSRGKPVHAILLRGKRFGWLDHVEDEPAPAQGGLPSPRLLSQLRAETATAATLVRPAQPARFWPDGRFPVRTRGFVGRGDLLLAVETELYVSAFDGGREGPATVAARCV